MFSVARREGEKYSPINAYKATAHVIKIICTHKLGASVVLARVPDETLGRVSGVTREGPREQ